MICEKCREAGEKNKAGKTRKAEKLHKECSYPAGCPCQHAVGNDYHRA